MIVNQTNRLHIGVDDRGSHKFKAQLFKIPADCLGQRCAGRNLILGFPDIYNRCPIHIGPEKMIERTVFFTEGKIGFGVGNGSINF